MWPNRQETAHLVTFTEEILIGKFHFVRSVTSLSLLKKSSLQKKLVNIDFEHDFQAVSFSFFEPNHFYKNNSSKKTQCIQNKYKKKKKKWVIRPVLEVTFPDIFSVFFVATACNDNLSISFTLCLFIPQREA